MIKLLKFFKLDELTSNILRLSCSLCNNTLMEPTLRVLTISFFLLLIQEWGRGFGWRTTSNKIVNDITAELSLRSSILRYQASLCRVSIGKEQSNYCGLSKIYLGPCLDRLLTTAAKASNMGFCKKKSCMLFPLVIVCMYKC